MADEVRKAKITRTNKLSAFTRKKNHLTQLLEGGASSEKLHAAYKDLSDAFKVLEHSHEDYMLVIEEDQLETEAAYLDDSAGVLSSLDLRINQAMENQTKLASDLEMQRKEDEDKATKEREFSIALAVFKSSISGFGKPSVNLAKLSEEKKISYEDMRAEITNLEVAVKGLIDEKVKVLNLNPTVDLSAELDLFNILVVQEVERCKNIALEYIKDAPSTTVAAVTTVASGGGVTRASAQSATKRETVMLPQFSGEEKTAFLQYPIWKKQWENHIVEYESKYRATMLLNHLDSKAKEQIVGHETDYDESIKKLEHYYNDPKKIIKACLDEIRSHSNIGAYDYKALVSYKKCLVNNYTRLKASGLDHEMSNTAALAVLVRKLPLHEAVKWQEYLAELDRETQSKPFKSFMEWLEKAGSSWELLAASGTGAKGKGASSQVHHSFYGDDGEPDKQSKPCFKCGETGHWKRDCTQGSKGGGARTGGGKSGTTVQKTTKDRQPPRNKKFHCALHKGAQGKNCFSWSCTALKYTPFEERIKLLRENGDCDLCCGDCPKNNCQSKTKRTCGGGKDGRGCGASHLGHELFCQGAKLCFSTQLETVLRSGDVSEDRVLLQVMKIPSIDQTLSHETVLWDSACTGIFVRQEHAQRMNFPFKEKRLTVATLGGHVRDIDGVIYDCKIRDQKGKEYEFQAHGLPEITGELGQQISKGLMKKLFPDLVGGHTLSGATKVDYLIGLGKASWQPQRVQQGLGGGDFWLWRNEFGTCVGGSHPWIDSFTSRSDALYTVLKTVVQDTLVADSLRIPTCTALNTRIAPLESSDFFRLEQLGTMVEPRCGQCRCGKCPVPGSRYSFREECELKMIEENLSYDEQRGAWITSYPYLFPRDTLKGSKELAFKTMVATEKTLIKRGLGPAYQHQIEDMLERGVARKVPEAELAVFNGPINYLPHLAALNPNSASTPLRICFDASRSQGGAPSLNQILAKGPDKFLNNLAGVIVNFRYGRYAAKGDVRKMYNCIYLTEEDSYMQCFMWRDLDISRGGETYQVVVNNIGVKPAGAIATVALRKSADEFQIKYPITAVQLRNRSYVDDLGLSASSLAMLKQRTQEADEILGHANMHVKKWTMSGDRNREIKVGETAEVGLLEESECERMLGVVWDPSKDEFKFKVRINLSQLKHKSRVGPDLNREDLSRNAPMTISRRQYYSQIQSLFDPIGLLAPVLLQAKILLRKTWEGECANLKWDDPLPVSLRNDMLEFFESLFDLEKVSFPRSLWPVQDVIGNPELVVFSDGSVQAFGAVVYVRWKISPDKWWPRLIMSKSKIAPKNRITIPRLELNGAVLAKRVKEFLVAEMDVKFDNVYHLVDSSTVLGYVHKLDSKLKPYEGIRVSEIQTSGTFVEGRLQCWSWIEGDLNPADWATKPRSVLELDANSFWQRGPEFLTRDYAKWPIKLDFKVERLDGELLPKSTHVVYLVSGDTANALETLLQNNSQVQKLFRIAAYLFKWKRIRESVPGVITAEEIVQAKKFWVKFVQQDVEEELRKSVPNSDLEGSKVSGKFRRLSPFKDDEEIWRIGHRMREFVPFTADKKPPMFVPFGSRLTLLLMRQAHQYKHSGIQETVSRFRLMGFWTTKATVLAKSVRSSCVICRILDKKPMHQSMGGIPGDRLENPIAWGHVETDLFGPFQCRSDVNKRSTIKVWGIVIIDKNSGATHCDIVMDYSAIETIKAFRRFASLRGWPIKVYSDPGSQLESSSGKLGSWWNDLKDQLSEFAANTNFSWELSPANSPWRQGQSEVRIKTVKRLLTIAVTSVRLTPLELQTALYEAANLCNERPLGINKTPNADGSYAVLTPNCLIMGRSLAAVPDDAKLSDQIKASERYHLINQVTSDFWSRWASEVTPEHVIRKKWNESGRNLQQGDVVLVHDKSPLKGKYIMGMVDSVKMGPDSRVRSCTISYMSPRSKDAENQYTGGRRIVITRSIQRLSLLLAVEEQDGQVEVVGDVVKQVQF